jgi:RNA polymerase sigma-54 factor
MKQGLSLRVSQHLALTPQLQQSIRLLQLSTLEMAQEVEQMLDDNPFLELDPEAAGPLESHGLAQADAQPSLGDRVSEWSTDTGGHEAGPIEESSSLEQHWEGEGTVEVRPDDSEWGGEAPAHPSSREAEDDVDAADLASEHLTLAAHLHQQALSLRLNGDERAALYCLIESLDEDGYLADTVTELAEALLHQLGWTEADTNPGLHAERMENMLQLLQRALHWLQNMEPTGVGASDLAECLRLQILELPNSPIAQAALTICLQPMDLLARRDVKRLTQLAGCTEDTARAAMALIASLEPKPGRRFANVQRLVVVPDVIVSAVGRGFKVELNPAVMPRLRVQDVYAQALKGQRGDAASGLQQRLQEARWFIKNIQQRFDTILRVAGAIVERQRSFFMHGELAMRPLVLREIADELGLHESTISRVTTAKYMATPFGTFELKYFFGSGLQTEAGGNASSTAVRALIKQFVAGENPAKPLSDNQIADMLKEQGIECARRTVAKYREALRIAPAQLRKTL